MLFATRLGFLHQIGRNRPNTIDSLHNFEQLTMLCDVREVMVDLKCTWTYLPVESPHIEADKIRPPRPPSQNWSNLAVPRPFSSSQVVALWSKMSAPHTQSKLVAQGPLVCYPRYDYPKENDQLNLCNDTGSRIEPSGAPELMLPQPGYRGSTLDSSREDNIH